MAHATVTCLHLSVHSIAPPSLHQAGQPIFYAECLMHGACGEGDVADEGTNAAGGVAVADWLTATFGGGDVNTGGPGAHTSGVDG